MPAGTTVWVFGDELNRRIGALGMARPETHRILFVEATEQIAGRRYHRQRLHLVLAGMRRSSAELQAEGFAVDQRVARRCWPASTPIAPSIARQEWRPPSRCPGAASNAAAPRHRPRALRPVPLPPR
jgi:deoxyribodipyrimidine photolyase-like uncharacterized protein